MTNAEKFIRNKDVNFKRKVKDVLSLFRGESCKFAVDVLSAATKYCKEDSVFNFERANSSINSTIKPTKND